MNDAAGRGTVRFSVQDRLKDPEVRRGYEEQSAVVEAARLVRRMREMSGLSQEILARQVGTSQAHLSTLERGIGKQGPTFLMLRKLARACGVQLQVSVQAPGAQASPGAGAERQEIGPPPRPAPARFRPSHDRVLVRAVGAPRVADDMITAAGGQGSVVEGEVISVGPGIPDERGQLRPLSLKAGDHVLFPDDASTEVSLEGEDVRILRESDIIETVGDRKPYKDTA